MTQTAQATATEISQEQITYEEWQVLNNSALSYAELLATVLRSNRLSVSEPEENMESVEVVKPILTEVQLAYTQKLLISMLSFIHKQIVGHELEPFVEK